MAHAEQVPTSNPTEGERKELKTGPAQLEALREELTKLLTLLGKPANFLEIMYPSLVYREDNAGGTEPVQLQELRKELTKLLVPLVAQASFLEILKGKLSMYFSLSRNEAIRQINEELALLKLSDPDNSQWFVPHEPGSGDVVMNQLVAIVTKTTQPTQNDLTTLDAQSIAAENGATYLREYHEFLKNNFDSIVFLVPRLKEFASIDGHLQTRVFEVLQDMIAGNFPSLRREAQIRQPSQYAHESSKIMPAFEAANIQRFIDLVTPYLKEQLQDYAQDTVAEFVNTSEAVLTQYGLAALCKLMRENGAVVTVEGNEFTINCSKMVEDKEKEIAVRAYSTFISSRYSSAQTGSGVTVTVINAVIFS